VSPAPNPEQADAFVLHNTSLTDPDLARFQRALEQGRGLVILAGPDLAAETVASLLGLPAAPSWQVHDEPRALQLAPVMDDPSLREIAWSSAPQVRERLLLPEIAGLRPLVLAEGTDEPVLGELAAGQGRIYVFTPWLTEEHNLSFLDWPYAHYFLHHLLQRAAGRTPPSYAQWPLSPVPHAGTRYLILAVGLVTLGLTVGLFLWGRSYALRHPPLLRRLSTAPAPPEARPWEEVGFHRPLAGFLTLLSVGLCLFIPLMVYQQIVLRRWLLPSPQAHGSWDLVVRFFEVFWLILDVGTGTAAVRFFAQYRVHEPQRGLRYLQFYLWWQALSGTVQLTAVALLAATALPHTAYAYLSFYIIVHTLIQFPGFLKLFQYTFRALQRTDYDQTLTLVLYMAPMLFQTVAVLLMRNWGKAHPGIGPVIGGVLGMGLGLYLTELAVFVVGIVLYRRLGLSLRALLLPAFDWETVRSALGFGSKVAAAQSFAPFGHMVQTVLISLFLANYTEVQGIWSTAYLFTLAYGALPQGLYEELLPAIAEAYHHGRRVLCRYYIAQGFKFGGWFSAFVLGALGAVGDRFILGVLGLEWERAAVLALPILAWGAMTFAAHFADRVQQATGRPGLQAILTAGEQALRIGLMVLLLQRLQVWGLLIAYAVALPVKGIAAWLLNTRWILRPRLYLWQSFGAPLLAAAVNYGFLRLVGNFLWHGGWWGSLALLILALLGSLPLYAFFTALLGGWDDGGVAELEQASRLSGAGRPLARLLYRAVAWGARLSPLHNRFPMQIRTAALEEAASLTQEKVEL
jgi:O-antigen/teichoic acid export membrane protein